MENQANFHCTWGENISFWKKGEGRKYHILGNIYAPVTTRTQESRSKLQAI